jgi:hypothetical protein
MNEPKPPAWEIWYKLPSDQEQNFLNSARSYRDSNPASNVFGLQDVVKQTDEVVYVVGGADAVAGYVWDLSRPPFEKWEFPGWLQDATLPPPKAAQLAPFDSFDIDGMDLAGDIEMPSPR